MEVLIKDPLTSNSAIMHSISQKSIGEGNGNPLQYWNIVYIKLKKLTVTDKSNLLANKIQRF